VNHVQTSRAGDYAEINRKGNRVYRVFIEVLKIAEAYSKLGKCQTPSADAEIISEIMTGIRATPMMQPERQWQDQRKT
jgi:hypothetical protein